MHSNNIWFSEHSRHIQWHIGPWYGNLVTFRPMSCLRPLPVYGHYWRTIRPYYSRTKILISKLDFRFKLQDLSLSANICFVHGWHGWGCLVGATGGRSWLMRHIAISWGSIPSVSLNVCHPIIHT